MSFPKRFSTQTCLLMLLEFWKQCDPNLRPIQNFWLFKSWPFESKASCLWSWPISIETTWGNILTGYLRALCWVLYCLIFLLDKFYTLQSTYFAGYTDANNLFVNRYNIKDIIPATEKTGERFLAWFSNNEMKLNTDKCYLLLNSHENNVIKISKKIAGCRQFWL